MTQISRPDYIEKNKCFQTMPAILAADKLTKWAAGEIEDYIDESEHCIFCTQKRNYADELVQNAALCLVMCCCARNPIQKNVDANRQRQNCVKEVINKANAISLALNKEKTIFTPEERYLFPKNGEPLPYPKGSPRAEGHLRRTDVTIGPTRANPTVKPRVVEMKFHKDIQNPTAQDDYRKIGPTTVLSAERAAGAGEVPCPCKDDRDRKHARESVPFRESARAAETLKDRALQAIDDAAEWAMENPGKAALGAAAVIGLAAAGSPAAVGMGILRLGYAGASALGGLLFRAPSLVSVPAFIK